MDSADDVMWAITSLLATPTIAMKEDGQGI